MPQLKSINWNLLILAYSSLFIMGLIDNSRGPIYPQLLETFHFSTSRGSLIFTLAAAAGLSINLTSRFWIRWIGAAKGILYSLGAMFIGALMMGLSPSLPYSDFFLFFFSFVLGLGLSACGISMNILVAQGTPEHLRRQAFAGLHSTYGIASFTAPFFIYLSTLINLHWYQYFIALSIVPLLFIFLLLPITPKSSNANASDNEMIPPFSIWKRLPYATLFGSYVASEILVSSRLVLYAQQAKDISVIQSGQMLSVFFFCLTFGRMFFTFVPIKFISSKTLLALSLIGSIIFFLLGISVSIWFVPLTGLAMSFFFPVGINWLNEEFPKHANFMTATAMTSIGFALIIVHFLFGKIAQHVSITAAFWLIPLCSMFSLLTLLYLHLNEKGKADE